MEIKTRLDLNKLLPPSPATAELGVAEGNFSFDICENWKPSVHYSVDNWGKIENVTGDGNFDDLWHASNYNAASKRLKQFECSKILRGITWEMAERVQDESLDLVYIDAGHYYEAVVKDIAAWFPKIKKGGVMAFHDYFSPEYGVMQAVQEFCMGRFRVYPIIELTTADSGAYFIKE